MEKKTFAEIIVFLIALVNTTTSQTFTVKGNVYTDSSPVRYAQIMFVDMNDTTKKYSAITDTLGNYILDIITDVKNEEVIIPKSVELMQNYPNPFSSSTAITYNLTKETEVTISIYDILGQEVKTFQRGLESTGTRGIVWDGTNNFGIKVTPGIYFYLLITNKETAIGKMICNTIGVNTNPVSLTNKYFASSSVLMRKNLEIEASGYYCEIKSIDSTKPLIVIQKFSDLIVDKDTLLNFNVEKARIILCRSIDEVKIGDDSLTVVNKLGKPDTIYYADLDGWIFAYIDDGNIHQRTYITLINNPIFISQSNAVISVEIGIPYTGKTKEGVGLGMNRDEVIKRLGEPTYTVPNRLPHYDYYNYEPIEGYFKSNFLLSYDEDNVLKSVSITGPILRIQNNY